MRPSISVVIPLYNREKLIERTIRSIYGQTYRPIRLIVVDNNSTDKGSEVVKSWAATHTGPDFTITLLHEPQQGAPAARNRGLEAVTTDWVIFFDSDDVMLPPLISEVIEAATREETANLVYWPSALISPDGSAHRRRFGTRNLLRRHLFNALLSTANFAVKTEFIRKAGAWNPELTCWDDFELGLRLLSHNPHSIALTATRVHVYPQKDSITGSDFHSKRGEWEKTLDTMQKYAHSLPPTLRDRITRYITYRRINLAALYAKEGATLPATDLLKNTLEECSHPSSPLYLPRWRRKLLNVIYHYTHLGGRAAYLMWR